MVPRHRRSSSADLMGGSQRSLESSCSSKRSTITLTPRRTPKKSVSGFSSAFTAMFRGNQNPEEKNKKSELNIFCNDAIVSTEFTLSRMEHAKKTPRIVKLELEDLLQRQDQSLFLEVLDVIVADKRPWEYVRMVDHLYSTEDYDRYIRLKTDLWRLLKDDASKRSIPVQFHATVDIPRGSTKEEVIFFFEGLISSQDTLSVQFGGALFGCMAFRVVYELERLCKRGHLSETVEVKLSFGTPVEVETKAGDFGVTLGKETSFEVIQAAIERLKKMQINEQGEGETDDGKVEPLQGEGEEKGTTRRKKLKRCKSDSVSVKLHPLRERKKPSDSSVCSDANSVSSGKSARRRKLKRNKTMSDVSRRRRDSESLDPMGASNPDMVSSLEKLSSMRKGMQKSINRRSSIGMSSVASQGSSRRNKVNRLDMSDGSQKLPSSVKIRRSRSTGESSAPSKLRTLRTAESANPDHHATNLAQKGNKLGTQKRILPRRAKSIDSSMSNRKSSPRMPRRSRRPAPGGKAKGTLSTVLAEDAEDDPVTDCRRRKNVLTGICAEPASLDLSAESENGATSLLEEIMLKDISRMVLYETVHALGPANNKPIMELFRAEPDSKKKLDRREADEENVLKENEESASVLDEIIEKSLAQEAKVTKDGNGANKTIMELFGANGLVEEKPQQEFERDVSNLTVDASTNSVGMERRVEAVLKAGSNHSSKKKKREKKKRSKEKNLHRSWSSLGEENDYLDTEDLETKSKRKSSSLHTTLSQCRNSLSTRDTVSSDDEDMDSSFANEGPDFDWETKTLLTC